MLLIFVVAVPISDRIVNSQAISALDPALLDDDLKRGAALRDIIAVASGPFPGRASVALKNAADVYSSLRSWTSTIIVGAGWIFGLAGRCLWTALAVGAVPRAQSTSRTVVKYVLLAAACVAVLHHDRHYLLGSVRDDAVLPRARRSARTVFDPRPSVVIERVVRIPARTGVEPPSR